MNFDASKAEETRGREEKMTLDDEMAENGREAESSAENCLEDDENSENSADKEFVFSELDLKRLRNLGLFKAYLEMLNSVPDLFKYSTQFQILPLNLCMDLQQQSTSKNLSPYKIIGFHGKALKKILKWIMIFLRKKISNNEKFLSYS